MVNTTAQNNSSCETTATQPENTSPGSCQCVSLETIVAIACGCSAAVLLLILLGVLGFILLRRRRSKDKPGRLDQGGNSSPTAKEVRQENVQNANAEPTHQQQATSLETDLMQPTYSNGYMLGKGSLNPNHHFSSAGPDVGPQRPSSHTQYTAIRSKKPELLLVVEEPAGPYTSLRATVNDLLNPYNTFEDFGDVPQTSGNTLPNRLHTCEARPDNMSMHISSAKPLFENMTHAVGLTYANSADEHSKLNVYQNSTSVVSINGETKNKKRKDKKKRKQKAESKSKNYKSGHDSEPRKEEHEIHSDLSLSERDIQSKFAFVDQNVYRNDRVYNNY